ncbi:hypothetical protein [Acetobacter sp.]|uniref:hypothetical protein n=1 Tax=Acetobacter sp. TaxID=440 RepID=UPI0039E88FB8
MKRSLLAGFAVISLAAAGTAAHAQEAAPAPQQQGSEHGPEAVHEGHEGEDANGHENKGGEKHKHGHKHHKKDGQKEEKKESSN